MRLKQRGRRGPDLRDGRFLTDSPVLDGRLGEPPGEFGHLEDRDRAP
jgi:hypothetical protein